MNKCKQFLALLLVLCMTLSIVPFSALAAENIDGVDKQTEAQTDVLDSGTVDLKDDSSEDLGKAGSDEGSSEGAFEGDSNEDSSEGASSESPSVADSTSDLPLNNEASEQVIEEEEIASWVAVPTRSARSTDGDAFYKIVHLDCGRKYFSPENIKKIIDNAAAAGFNQVELYLSDNQGFRFALDDMNVTTSTGNTYYLTPALGDGYSDGSKYPDYSGKYLTQSEMTGIISYAADKGIDIVPCINVPGHMGAILEEFTQFKYSGSNSSIDLENNEAVAFALAITEKYAAYFENQGVKFYNLGADEYANDLSTMGFQGLYTSGKYQKFVDFLNSAAQIVINHGMTPRAFNDGIYYNEDNTYTINSKIQVCYWSCGWNGYNLAPAQYLVNQGMDVINTHGDYYWVLGNSGWQCSADKASQFDYTSFQYKTGTTGNGTISDPAGAMFCIWCDVGNADGQDDGTAVVSATADVIAAFGAALPASESGGDSGDGGDGDTGNTGDVEVTKEKTITVTVGQTATATISGANYAGEYTTEDPSIATVVVTGTDATEATTAYKQASVTCDTLISRNSNNWTAVSGYYYKADDGNYYQLYAKRSRQYSWNNGIVYTYTYTWGYSTTSSANNVTQIGTQSTTETSTTPNITVYTKTDVQAVDASTTITFYGVKPGTTYVTIGNTRYEIVVDYIREEVPVVVGQEVQIENVSGTLDDSQLNTSIATVSVENGIMTVTGVTEGNTQVTVGNTIYTIIVTNVDLDKVEPLTVEFWITNRRVEANGANDMTIAASTEGVYSASGVPFSNLVPATGTLDSNTMVFWKGTRLASDNKQTEGSGVDKTNSGTDFTYIRYWDGSWAYSADGKTWNNVDSGDQIVAYYLQKTEVTDEVTTEVVDWGVVPSTSYDSTNFVLVDFAVKYESGELTPSSFPVSGKTMAFHCDPNDTNTVHQYNGGSSSTWYNNYRDIGMIKAEETADYEVYMITFTPTSDGRNTQVATNANAATSYTYGGTEKVVWVDDEANLGDFADESLHYTSISGDITYSVGGDPIIPGIEIFNRHGMLVTYYVRAKVTEDSLAVHYIDQTANQEFYSYNIAVKSGTLFNENIGLANPWKGNLANGSVTNLQDKTQTVSADLSTMPAIGAQYRYSDYTCVNVERSEDGKDVYLYYTFNNTHSFVVDFGLPVEISASQISDNIESLTGASITGAKYGSAEINGTGNLVYTPTKMLGGTESLTLTITENNSTASQQIYIYPATTVYYEEGFATYSDGWTETGSKGSGTQADQVAGSSKDEYGYDAAYVNHIGASNGTQATSNAAGNTCNFTFTGTGFEVYANCTPTSGYISSVVIRNQNGATVKAYLVNTVAKYGSPDVTIGQDTIVHSLPIISEQGMTHGTYTVTITHIKDNSPIYIDGFRIYETLATEPDFYTRDSEDKPIFIELRDRVLASLNAEATNSSQYADQIAGNTLSQVYATADTTQGVVITAATGTYTNEQLTDLLDNDPKNEIFLRNGQALTVKITTNREVQIGLKAPISGTTYTVNNGESKSINTSTDMFYTVLNKGTSGEQTITITNTGSGILSVTKLKVCDDPNAVLGTLTEEDLIPAMLSLGFKKDPNGSESTVPFLDVAKGDWFYDAVKYVYENGLMYGTASDMFSPNSNATRGMIVTILYRESGSPDVNSDGENWWSDARVWAMENGISDGTNMDANITREQMAAMLYRYAKLMDADVSARGNLDKFSDREQISGWAMEAVQWAVGEKIIAGRTNGTLDPQGLATRAEVAAMLMRFDKKLG